MKRAIFGSLVVFLVLGAALTMLIKNNNPTRYDCYRLTTDDYSDRLALDVTNIKGDDASIAAQLTKTIDYCLIKLQPQGDIVDIAIYPRGVLAGSFEINVGKYAQQQGMIRFAENLDFRDDQWLSIVEAAIDLSSK